MSIRERVDRHIKLAPESFRRFKDPKNLYATMRHDIQHLLKSQMYLSLTTVIVCWIDALAAGPGEATRGKFNAFVREYFPDLCAALEKISPGKDGANIFYDGFRNGFAHLGAPKPTYWIVEDHELKGSWAVLVEDPDRGEVVKAVNVDRLARQFLTLLDLLSDVRFGVARAPIRGGDETTK
jgi:hypothetical protein